MNIEEVKEQLQEDLLSFVDGWGIKEALGLDFFHFTSDMCDIVINNLNKLENNE